jgi:hypothetical protein
VIKENKTSTATKKIKIKDGGEVRNEYNNSSGEKPAGKRLLSRPKSRWTCNTK